MKEQIKIILIGDTGTGKSSVISSYISKYFPNEVPAVLVDAIIPPDSTANNVSVTIMDSSALLGDRDVLHQKIRMADSIIALFDVTRPETIDSLEELWLPTIRDICGTVTVSKAVIVVGNKTDLVGDQDEMQLEVEKIRMKKILKDFPFVVACYRCSAKHVDVDQIFYESELAVTFPVGPLFDTTRSEFTAGCKVAFLRIFRCFDFNQDGLLNDEELNCLQQQSFGVPLKEEEVASLKQEVSKSVRGGMLNECITFKGLMGIMRLFIYRGQQQTPWTMLARFGYQDLAFHLEIPFEVEEEAELCEGESFELSGGAYDFLYNLAVNASSRRLQDDSSDISQQHGKAEPRGVGKIKGKGGGEDQGEITWADLGDILAAMPSVSHPWSYPPICQDDYGGSVHVFLLSGGSAPPTLSGSMMTAISDSGIFTSWMHPTVDISNPPQGGQSGVGSFMDGMGGEGFGGGCSTDAVTSSVSDDVAGAYGCGDYGDMPFCSVNAWMAQWQMFAVHRPVLVQTLLFRMGYVEREDLGLSVAIRTSRVRSAAKRVINICLLGGVGVGKADLVRAMSSLAAQTSAFGPHSTQGDVDLEAGTGGAGSSYSYAEEEAAYIESEGYPLHVLRTGYDCDVQEGEGEVQMGGEGGKVTEPRSACATSYVHGSCSQPSGAGRVSLVFTAVPYDRAGEWMGVYGTVCDLAVLVLDCRDCVGLEGGGAEGPVSSEPQEDGHEDGSMRSLQSARILETMLPALLPRLFVANRSDLLGSQTAVARVGWGRGAGTAGSIPLGDEAVQRALRPVFEHLQKHQLPPLVFVSTVSGEGIEELKRELLRISSHPHLGTPTSYRKEKNKLIWVAGRVMCAVVTVALIASAIMLRREPCKEEGNGSKCLSWARRAMLRVLSVTQRE